MLEEFTAYKARVEYELMDLEGKLEFCYSLHSTVFSQNFSRIVGLEQKFETLMEEYERILSIENLIRRVAYESVSHNSLN